mmetsp:Transcript_15784/g.24561  ORF Transcript_15784/g.24561 Transcript_15784/m.24561 type:complete len:106 (-) Transcript_15784:151-468(-)
MDKAKTCHPDVSDSPDAQAQFVQISEAYTTLMDDESRRAYDQAWMQARAGIRDAKITKPMSKAQSIIVVLAGLVTGAPIIVPLVLAKTCVEPFASTIKSLSKSCF